MQACKVKIYSAPETRGFVKGPSPHLISQAYCRRSRTFSFSFEKNYTLKCFNCSTDNYSLRNQSMPCIPSKCQRRRKEHMHVHFGDVACLYSCVPLAIKTIMIVLFKILTLFRFKAIRSSSLTLNEILIALIAKGTQGIILEPDSHLVV